MRVRAWDPMEEEDEGVEGWKWRGGWGVIGAVEREFQAGGKERKGKEWERVAMHRNGTRGIWIGGERKR